MEANMQNFLPILASSRLFPPNQATDLYARWAQTPGAKSGDFEQFSKWLVAQNHLTEYQVSVLLRGRASALFLDDYKLLDRIGLGDMAGVYKAIHKLGQVVAIKVLPPSKAKDPQQFARFQREARLAVRLKHPNIVRTFQKGEANGVHYLVMEYLEGETLQSIMKQRGQLPVVEAVRAIYQALLGLQHLHQHGMVHRDLQPANLMVIGACERPGSAPGASQSPLADATVKILDVGVAKVLFDDSAKGELGAANLTVQGDMLGMAGYIAPEQARDARRADIRSDIYSLGCILFEGLAGKRPFAGLLGAMARPAGERKIPDLRGLNPQVPEGLQRVVEAMLASDPAQRPATPEIAAEALKPFLTAMRNHSATPELPSHTQAYLQWVESISKEEGVDYDLTQPEPEAAGPVSATKPPASSPRQAAVAPVARKSAQGVLSAPRPARFLGLTLRDFTMLAVGMGTGILLTLLLAKLLPMLADRVG